MDENFLKLKNFLLVKMLEGRLHPFTFARVKDEPHYFVKSELPIYEEKIKQLGVKLNDPKTFEKFEFYPEFCRLFDDYESSIRRGELTVSGLWAVFFTRKTLTEVKVKNTIYKRVEKVFA